MGKDDAGGLAQTQQVEGLEDRMGVQGEVGTQVGQEAALGFQSLGKQPDVQTAQLIGIVHKLRIVPAGHVGAVGLVYPVGMDAGTAFHPVPEVVHSLADLGDALVIALQLHTGISGAKLVSTTLHAGKGHVVVFLQIVGVHILLVVALVVQVSQGAVVVFLVVSDQDAQLTAGEALAAHQRHAGDVAEGTQLLALVHTALGVGNILDDLQIVLLGEGHDGIHVSGIAAVMHHDDSLGPGAEAALQVVGVQIHGVGLHIGKYHGSAQVLGGQAAGPVGLGGADDLITGLQTDGVHGSLQGHGAVGGGYGVIDALPGGKFLFEFNGGLVAGHGVVEEYIHQGIFVFLGEDGPLGQFLGNQRGIQDGLSAQKCELFHKHSPYICN